jgi:hypothetical protein
MIQKVGKKYRLEDPAVRKEELAYWASRTPEERISAVEYLRRQNHGSSARLQRVARVIQRLQGGRKRDLADLESLGEE